MHTDTKRQAGAEITPDRIEMAADYLLDHASESMGLDTARRIVQTIFQIIRGTDEDYAKRR